MEGLAGKLVQPDFPTEDLRVLGLAKGLRDPSVFRLLAQEREEEALAEKLKASVRAKAEHPFLKVKRLFGYAKVRYRGLAKNTQRLALLLGLGKLMAAEGNLAG